MSKITRTLNLRRIKATAVKEVDGKLECRKLHNIIVEGSLKNEQVKKIIDEELQDGETALISFDEKFSKKFEMDIQDFIAYGTVVNEKRDNEVKETK